jgi:hypothetical protein
MSYLSVASQNQFKDSKVAEGFPGVTALGFLSINKTPIASLKTGPTKPAYQPS